MTPQADSDSVRRFADEYLQMSDGELLCVAAAYDSLVEPAQDALREEFVRRGLEPPVVEEREEVTSQPLVTLRRYRDLSEAIVYRSVLESAGIYCFLQDENFLRIDWGAAIALGGIRLQVRPDDTQAAEELLSQPIPESSEDVNRPAYIKPHCPRCGSIDVAAPALFELNQRVSPGSESWQCHVCGCRWADDLDEAKSETANGPDRRD
jgi:hypothetical protein